MTTCPSFTESVKCTADGDHTIAWGWTTSTGQWGSFPYTPPTGWKFDPRYSDERGPTGSHGGCRTCIMTLVHLITTQGDLVPTPTPTPGTHPTSGTVIDRISRAGDVGEPGYSVWGQELPACTYSGSHDDWHGATQDALSAVLPTCYITESVYSFLTDDEIESVRGRLQGIVPNSYAYQYSKRSEFDGRTVWCWEFKPDVEARPVPVPDPCAGVVCEDICIGADKYSQVCAKEGVDAGNCILGTLIEENSVECGYVPPDDDEPDDEPDPGEPDDYIPPVDDDTSELATDISSIFGDIKPIYIIIAAIAIIILGLLS